MAGGGKPILWAVVGVGLWLNQSLAAAPCIRLTGVIQDYSSQQPLTAQLYVKTQTGRYSLGNSVAKTGQFIVDVTCSAVALVVEKEGYRPQTLLLRVSELADKSKPVAIIIPLVAIDRQGVDRPYFQTEQTHFVQATGSKKNARPQRGTFVISDAITGKFLPAQACFYFTKSSQKRCKDANSTGQFSFNFAEKDIVALEVNAPGYQTYQGQLIVEQLDGHQIRHDVRLTRELTLLSVRLDASAGGCELRSEVNTRKVINMTQVPGRTGTCVAYDLLPQGYTLVIFDQQHNIREQRPVTLQSGLNVVWSTPEPTTVSSAAVTDLTSTILPDSLTILYFEQGSYLLQPTCKMTLAQIATYLTQHPGLSVQLSGHTDREGNEQMNRTLSEFRAKVTATFLSQHGVPDERIEIIGHGSRFPVAASDTEAHKASNRRVHLKFIVKKML